jgi:hypothetical protein
MADPAYRSITPRTLGRNAYIPENDPEFMRRQQEPSSYDLFKQSVIKSAYDEALRATGSEERAMEVANSVSRKMFRTELIGSVVAPEAAIAGAGRAVNVAKGLFGREKAAEAVSPLLLSGPRRNAMMPDEMLAADTPSVLRMAPDRPVSLPNSQSLPRLEYDIPTIRSTGMPPARDVVSSPFDDIGRFAGEGGVTDDAVMAARRMAQERIAAGEAAQARRISEMEGEGGSYVGDVIRRRELGAVEEAAQRSRQISALEGEGGPTADAIQVAREMYARRQAAEQAAQQTRVDRMIDEGGGMAMTRPMERATLPPGTGFTLGESSASGAYRPNFTRPEGSRFGLPALRSGTDAVATGSPAASTEAAAAAGGYDVGAILRKLGIAGMGLGAGAAAVNTARDMYGNGPVPANAGAAMGQAEASPNNLGLPAAEPAPALYGLEPPASQSASGQAGSSAPAIQQAAAPAVPASIGLWQRYNEAVERGDSGQNALFVMANKAAREEAEGRKSGGSVKEKPQNTNSKDAAMHKALEIIHHMMVNR